MNDTEQDINCSPNLNSGSSSSTFIIIFIGFLITYLLFFIWPIFLNSEHFMTFFKYVPRFNPIGIDLKQMLSYSESWFILKQTPYIGQNLYPPLASVFFTPLLMVDFPTAYAIIVILNVACFIFITFIFPWRMSEGKHLSPLLILFLVSGLFSYGLQFELERGQFNLIAMFFCITSIWIYHRHDRYRYLAYFLFSISIQLKIFPAIFIVMFIKDWKDWKNNIKRLASIIIFNFALLFVLGPQVFVDFLKAIRVQAVNPFVWFGNHSISSFIGLFQVYGGKSPNKFSWVTTYSGLIQFLLLGFVAVCILIIILQAYRRQHKGINGYLLLACTVGALVIPPVSHDYKLSILVAPVAAFSCVTYENYNHRLRVIVTFLTLVFSLAYSSTLFSYTNKPTILGNNLPALLALLFITTGFSLMAKPDHEPNSGIKAIP
jgi:Glycosyltransferase family 87